VPAPDLIELLRGLHFLRDVDEAALAQLAPSLVKQQFGAGELILRQAAFAKGLALIAEGEASVLWAEPEAPPVELYRLGVGDTFGELELAYGETYHASLTALAPTVVYFWEQSALEAGLQAFPTALASLRYLAQSRRLALRLRFDWLGEGETVCGLSRKDPNLLFGALSMPLALTLGGLGSLWWGAGSPLAWIGGGLLILGLGLAAWRWFDWRNDYYIVTNQRVVWLEKVIGLYDSRQESPLHMLLSVTVSTDFTGRTLGYGDVILRTYTGQITFRAVNDPHSMAAIIEERRHRVQGERDREDREVVAAALRRRLEEGGGEAAAEAPVQPTASVREPDRARQAIGLDHWTFQVRFEEGGVITYRKHWAVLLRVIGLPSITVLLVVGLLGASLGGLLRIFSFEADLIAGLLLLVPAFGWWVYQFMDWANDLYQITADQILDVYKKPLARELRKIAPLENILGTQVKRKGIVGLLLNYGDVVAQVGTEEFSFEGVFEPNRVQQDIVRAQEALVERRRELERRQRRDELAEWFGVYHEESRQRQGEEASG